MKRITPCLWFDRNAEEAVDFYLAVFKNGRRETITYYGKAGPGPEGSVLTIAFQLEGQAFLALNGGPVFAFSPAISLMVSCDTQSEIDSLWAMLTAGGGEEGQCGWLKDRFGVSWQIVPRVMGEMLADPDPIRVQRVMETMLPMRKLDLGKLRAAYEWQ